MQDSSSTKNSSTNDCSTINKKSWYRSQGWLFGLIVIATINFAWVGFYVAGQMQINPAVLILKHDGCELMREYGVSTQPHGVDECRVTVQYETNFFRTLGTIHIGDQQIRMAADQIIVVGTIDNSWTPHKVWLIGWQIISIAFLISLLVLFARTLF